MNTAQANAKRTLTEADLRQFSGGEERYRHALLGDRFTYTEGVKFLAEQAGAYWLIDAIASYQLDRRIRGDAMLRDFQLWTLRLHNGGAILALTRDSGFAEPTVIEQFIEYTDFPLAKVRLYVENGVLLLPSEH